MRTEHDYDAWETLAAMGLMSVIEAFGVLAFIGLFFNLPVFSMGKLVTAGLVFGLTGVFFSILLIRNWNRDRH